MKKKKGTWGGKRERKVKKEPTKVMRVPISKVESVKEFLNNGTQTRIIKPR